MTTMANGDMSGQEIPPRVKTLVELKARLRPGTQVLQIWNGREGPVHHVLTVSRVQTRAVETTCPDFPDPYTISFPNRGAIAFTENGWIRLKGDRKMAEYVWMLESAGEGVTGTIQ